MGRVIGTVVASAKCESLRGFKLLLIQPIDIHGADRGASLVATDRTGVGPGEIVLLEKSKEAVLGLADPMVPSDASVVGKVDSSHVYA